MSAAPTPTYEERLITLDLTPMSDLRHLLRTESEITFLDVRTPEEILAAPFTLPSNMATTTNTAAEAPPSQVLRLVAHPCTRTDATSLVQLATTSSSSSSSSTQEKDSSSSTFLPNKDGVIIIFCKSGARAKTGKLALEQVGYTRIYNAGGVDDIQL